MDDKNELIQKFQTLAHAIQLLTYERDKISREIYELRRKANFYDDEIDELSKKIISVGERMSKI